MKAALDTNVLVYAEGWGDAERCQRAGELVARLFAEVGAPTGRLIAVSRRRQAPAFT